MTRNAFTGVALQVINESNSDKTLAIKLPIVADIIRNEFIRVARNLSAARGRLELLLTAGEASVLMQCIDTEIELCNTRPELKNYIETLHGILDRLSLEVEISREDAKNAG